MERRPSTPILFLIIAALFITSVRAGCYRKGYSKSYVPPEELSFNHEPAPAYDEDELPKKFNWCNQDGLSYCVTSWNQHIPYYCGSCWAHATISMIQDRLKIAKGGRGIDVMLSRQTMLNCGHFYGFGKGCNGGDPIDVFRYMKIHGLPDESCLTYNATDHSKFPNHKELKECPAEGICLNCMVDDDDNESCWAVKTPIKYYLKRYGQIGPTEQDMMSEIYHRGPIVCSCATPMEFVYNYHSGVYVDTTNSSDVDHNIEVVGWGEENGLKYWLIRNSWGSYWGGLGFFKLQRGVNALHIEDGDCWYAEPEYQMEKDVKRGKLMGTMFGVVPNPDWKEEDPAAILKNRKYKSNVQLKEAF